MVRHDLDMTTLETTSADWRAALQTLQDISARASGAAAFAEAGVELLPRLVPSELTTMSVCRLRDGRREVVSAPGCALGAAECAAFDRHFDQHPLVRYHGHDGGCSVRRISDSVPFSRFRHGALYSDYYRRITIDHALALPILVGDGLLVSFVLNRGRHDFSDRERDLLDALRAPLGRVYDLTRALDMARADVHRLAVDAEREGLGWLRLSPEREVVAGSAASLDWLSSFAGAQTLVGRLLPAVVDNWLAAWTACPPAAADRLLLESSGNGLALHATHLPYGEGAIHLQLTLRHAPAPADGVAASLTLRETEVMHWVAAGKTDRDIAALLACSHRTVQKHLERVYAKLGVETRPAAALRCIGPRR